MISRRTFSKLAGTAAAGALAATSRSAPAAAGELAPPNVVETDTEIVVDNGPVQLTVNKTNGRATSIMFGGQNLIGTGGRGNYDMNNAREGASLPLPPSQNSYEIRQQADFVDIVFRYSPTDGGPFWLDRHHIIRTGEPGIHLANTFHHTPDLHGFRSDQHRYVFYLNRDIFTHCWVGDDPIGVRWRDNAARMPTPDELSAAPVVMDATHDLAGVGSAYPRRYYTKYDWAVYLKDHKLHGLYGNGFGIWLVLPNKEAFSGGPVRQELTLHQTTDRPVLLVEPQGTHYGSPPVRVAAGQEWHKTYGPYFVYFAQGDDPARMRSEALRYGRFGAHADFYDRLALPGWAGSTERATVTGRIAIAGTRPRGAVAVLSDNRLDFQRTALGHNYWADVTADGTFAIRHVRPGTYRLTVYQPGVWGEYVHDDVVVTAGRTPRLGDLRWRPVSNGRTVFQIGTPNRMSVEFHNGSVFRQYGLFQRHPEEFPNGVVYTVGQSTNDDWNYVQYQRIGGLTGALPAGRPIVPPDTPGVRLFDFGGSSNPAAPGFLRVTNTTVYEPNQGYGLDRPVDFRDRGQPDDLRRDFVLGSAYTFRADLPNGDYEVTVTSGDAIAANTTSLSVQGQPAVALMAASGEFAVHRTTATVSDGTLTLALSGDGRLNAVEVVAADAAYSALTGLTIGGLSPAPAFHRFLSDYRLDVAYDVTSLEVTTTDESGSETRTVELTGREQTIEIVTQRAGAAPATYRLHIVRQEAPWRIRFDAKDVRGSVATLTIALAAWAMDTARPIPDAPSNLTITLNGSKQVWTFEPDEVRGATYRSGCGGRTFRRELRFDAALLKPTGNEIVLRLNEHTAPEVGTEAAYDAIRLEIS